MAFGFMSFTWFEERHEGQTLVDDVVTKHVPPHIGLFYCLGGIVFMALVAQFTSGLVLTFYFTPTVDDAYLSVEPLELSRHSGQLFGSVHRWASNLMLLAILLHLSRVFRGLCYHSWLYPLECLDTRCLGTRLAFGLYKLYQQYLRQLMISFLVLGPVLSVPFEEVSQLVKRHSTEPLQHIH